MICYKDRTYCNSRVEHHTCGREFTKKDHNDAVRWWGGEDYPLALGNFCNTHSTPSTQELDNIKTNIDKE